MPWPTRPNSWNRHCPGPCGPGTYWTRGLVTMNQKIGHSIRPLHSPDHTHAHTLLNSMIIRSMYTVVCTPNKMASNLSILFKMMCISPSSIPGDDKLSELSATKLGNARSSYILRSSICTRISITSSISRTVRSLDRSYTTYYYYY